MLSKIEQKYILDRKALLANNDALCSVVRDNSELENIVIFQLLRDFNSNNMQVLFGRKKSNQKITRRKNLQKMLKIM